jgi:stage II sporulation protein D
MSLPLRNNLLPGLARLYGVRGPRRNWLWYGLVGLLGTILLVILFHGCEQRQIVRPTPQMNIESQFWVRVLLAKNASEGTLTAPAGVSLTHAGSGAALPASGSESPALSDAAKVTISNGRLLLDGTPLPADEVILSPKPPHVFGFNGSRYRGKLRLSISAGRDGFEAVNLVPLEPYLAGVIGAEMPDYWEPEALKAQAIAARTYCLYSKNRFGVNRSWDVSRTQASQVYAGVRAESAQVWNAVNRTYGKVLVSPADATGALNGPSGLFPAYYSSVCGGHTENSANVFGDTFAPLAGAPCPYCKDVAKLGLFFWPMAQVDRAAATERLIEKYPKLAALGQVRDVVAAAKSHYGEFSRLTRIKLVGSTGRTDVLRAEDLRLTLDPTGQRIKSTACHIVPWGDGWAFLSGRGWGHGVGLCQHGAEGMARRGKTSEEILQHYYPGSKIIALY